MAYSITGRCVQCELCVPKCPTGAIKWIDGQYWINPNECNGCEGFYDEPQCITACPVDSLVPFQPKKGRCRTQDRPALSLDLFLNGKNNSFASAIVMWELCNILTQQRSLPWQTDADGFLVYERRVNRGRGLLTFWLTDPPDPEVDDSDEVECLKEIEGEEAIATLDIRSACLHLIYAAHATAVEAPWENAFVLSDRQIESYLGLDKRKDLSKLDKLRLIRELAQQPCSVAASIDWPRQGQVPGFSLHQERLWHMDDIIYHFEEDDLGCRSLVGLTFRIRAGRWAEHFLNQQGYWNHSAFYQYGSLPRCLLPEVMSHWQKHEGAMRMMLWLLFKTKMGHDQPVTAQTLMRVAYGEDRLAQASGHSALQNRVLKTFESDLETLHYYGLQPMFDPETYPPEIQPLWARLAELPDDAEAALEFWTEDGSHHRRLTDAAPRSKWKRVMNGRLLRFDLPETWEVTRSRTPSRKRSPRRWKTVPSKGVAISGEQIVAARKRLKLSQRSLAQQVGKSQSWIRDVENGRFRVNPKDQNTLCKVLQIES